jgi:hypothetical protein
MLGALTRWAFGLPNRNPGFSVSLTGVFAFVGVIAGIAVAVQPATPSTAGAVPGGILLSLLSLLLLGYTVYAFNETGHFQYWLDSNGRPRFGFLRWAGPVLLGLSIIASVIFLIIAWEALRAALENS